MSEASSITVFLADDNLIVREGVRALLEVEDDQLARAVREVADLLHAHGRRVGQTDELETTVLMSDIRGSTTIAQATNPRVLAGQLNEHRAAMNRAIVEHGGTVMQFVGEAVNLTQCLQQWADPGETVLSDATLQALTTPIVTETLEPALVKGRQTPVTAHRHPPRTTPAATP